MKKILITGGPTTEQIDDVMKITNTANGGFAAALAEIFADSGYEVTAVLGSGVKIGPRDGLRVIRTETSEQMMKAIENEARQDNTDAVIHTATVGDYQAEFSFLLEDMADEIFGKLGRIKSAEDILDIMKDPKCRIGLNSRLPGHQDNLAIKMARTPKIMSKLRFWYPNSLLIGCKLIDGAEKGELFDSATALCNKNHMDYVLANDLSDVRKGDTSRYLINKDGFTQIILSNTYAIYKFVDEKLR